MSARSIGNHRLNLLGMDVAVQMQTAVDDHDRKGSRFHHHESDDTYAPVKQPKVCEGCGRTDLKDADCVTGYPHEGDTVMITEDEKKVIAQNSGADIEVQWYVDAKQVNPLLFAGEKCYYLTPDLDPKRGGKLAAQKYITVMRIMSEEGWVGVVQYTKWGKTRLALLRVVPGEDGDILTMQNILWPDELRAPEFPTLEKAREIEVDPRLLPIARATMQSMVKDWDDADYTDTYQELLTKAIETKAGGQVIELSKVLDAPKVDDMDALLAQLSASVKPKDELPPKPSAKDAPAKKAPAKKAAPKKVVA